MLARLSRGVLAMLVVCLAGLALAVPAEGRVADGSRRTVADGTRGKVVGMGISPAGYQPADLQAEFPRIRSASVNTVSIDQWWDVDSSDSTTVHPGSRATDDATLRVYITAARNAGFAVALVPKIWCPNCSKSWRGLLQPSDRDAFFQSYRDYVLHYADLAQQTGVAIFFFGSEMTSLEEETDQWRAVAAQVREHFTSGQLTYDANWPDISKVGFWDAVDFISMSAYFPLSDEQSPSQATLVAAWHKSQSTNLSSKGKDWFGEVRNVAAKTQKGVLFGEVGYASTTYAARRPYVDTDSDTVDQGLQARLYQAVLQTFENESWWLGGLWWQWYPSDTPKNYSPRGKLSETFMKKWYGQGLRPASPDQPLVGPGSEPKPDPSHSTRPPGPSVGPTGPGSDPGTGSGHGGGSVSPGPRGGSSGRPGVTPSGSPTPGAASQTPTADAATGISVPQALDDVRASRITLPAKPVGRSRTTAALAAAFIIAAGAYGSGASLLTARR